ncbi:LysR family transcriptional regulator [Mesorhizobium sp. M1338]|uniref:LysR family transcriptional regulator n=1 Tax=Mesorhizobium sp. M1338 TaxID=2957085 RepID=UPI00333C0EDF
MNEVSSRVRYWRAPPMKSLLALEATARHASFSAAASELNVNQSAISHRRGELVLLIDRTTRPISLYIYIYIWYSAQALTITF